MRITHAALAAALLAGPALAQKVCYTDAVPLRPTNWTDSLTIPRFDPDLGTLTGIQFELVADSEVVLGIESLDPSPDSFTASHTAQVRVFRPGGGSEILSSTPAIGFAASLAGFDGVLDFAGPSGYTSPLTSASQTATASSPPPASDLALFTGPAGSPGAIALPVTAMGQLSVTGAGNIVSFFQAGAGATLQVCYLFTPAPSTICPPQQTIPLQQTNWNQPVTFPRFDPNLGVLVGVEFQLSAGVEVTAQFENLDNVPSLVLVTLSGRVRVFRPGGISEILSAMPTFNFNESVTAYDGVTDYGGTSGRTYPPMLISGSSTATSPPPAADLALFTGPAGMPGTISLPVTAMGTSSAGGPGNFASSFLTRASATVGVCYQFYPDCDGNGIADYIDIQNGAADTYGFNVLGVTCGADGIPDSCQPAPDTDGDGLPDACDPVGFTYCLGDGSGTPCPCANSSTPIDEAGCRNSLGLAGALRGAGAANVSGDTLVLTCSDLPATATALFFQGDAATNGGAGSVFGDGLRCASGTVVRLSTKTAVAGVVTYPVGGDLPISVVGSVPANATRYYQTWYRNAAAFCTSSTFNLSQGFRVVWQP